MYVHSNTYEPTHVNMHTDKQNKKKNEKESWVPESVRIHSIPAEVKSTHTVEVRLKSSGVEKIKGENVDKREERQWPELDALGRARHAFL